MSTQAALERAISTAGGPNALARAVGVKSHSVVNQWRITRVPAEHCPAIEGATGVRCEELRPDVPWRFLRVTDTPIQSADEVLRPDLFMSQVLPREAAATNSAEAGYVPTTNSAAAQGAQMTPQLPSIYIDADIRCFLPFCKPRQRLGGAVDVPGAETARFAITLDHACFLRDYLDLYIKEAAGTQNPMSGLMSISSSAVPSVGG